MVGADTAAKDKDGFSASYWAKKGLHEDCLAALPVEAGLYDLWGNIKSAPGFKDMVINMRLNGLGGKKKKGKKGKK
jgi:hypothetical protein